MEIGLIGYILIGVAILLLIIAISTTVVLITKSKQLKKIESSVETNAVDGANQTANHEPGSVMTIEEKLNELATDLKDLRKYAKLSGNKIDNKSMKAIYEFKAELFDRLYLSKLKERFSEKYKLFNESAKRLGSNTFSLMSLYEFYDKDQQLMLLMTKALYGIKKEENDNWIPNMDALNKLFDKVDRIIKQYCYIALDFAIPVEDPYNKGQKWKADVVLFYRDVKTGLITMMIMDVKQWSVTYLLSNPQLLEKQHPYKVSQDYSKKIVELLDIRKDIQINCQPLAYLYNYNLAKNVKKIENEPDENLKKKEYSALEKLHSDLIGNEVYQQMTDYESCEKNVYFLDNFKSLRDEIIGNIDTKNPISLEEIQYVVDTIQKNGVLYSKDLGKKK